MIRYLGLLIPVFFIFSLNVFAQTAIPPLEREITVSISNLPLGDALKKIAEAGQFNFSYNPAIINTNKMVQVQVHEKTVRETLRLVLDKDITCKTKGNYIILLKKNRLVPMKNLKGIL